MKEKRIMATIELRQFKLTNQEEIVTEVLDFGDEETDHAIVVRNTMKLVNLENKSSGMRYYAFRPFMLYQGDYNHVQIINPGHVVSECTPTKQLVEQYTSAVEEMMKDDDKENSLKDTKKAMKDYHKKMSEVTGDRFISTSLDYDSNSNVVSFKRPKILH
tara:strand:- start:1233 stop:1712 length:480 start_codon:yes stop_codon:yes gene_type:complete